MSLSGRDRDAFELVVSRWFGEAHVAALALDSQARRLTVRFYGSFEREETATQLATITFFGASDLRLDNPNGTFPESVSVASFVLAYDDDADVGTASLGGRSSWSLAWRFDGLAYEAHPAQIASLADDLPSAV